MDIDELRQRLERGPSNEAWVDAIADYFESHALAYGHGTDNAGDEAFWLLRAVQQWRDEPWSGSPDPELLTRVLALAAARVGERKPLAYLLGEAWFAGMRFKVDERVLIPRSPLAELIERRFEPWVRLRDADRLLDVGTGSGCLAIAAVAHCPGIEADATDLSAAALTLAEENAAMHGVGSRVQFIRADLFPDADTRYRVIISNPPYVAAAELESLPPEYAHEPAEALCGGPAGLEPVHRILNGAGDRLMPDGVLIVEVGDAADALQREYPAVPFVWIELERGGSGVFVLGADELVDLK